MVTPTRSFGTSAVSKTTGVTKGPSPTEWLTRAIAEGDRILLDSVVLISYFNGNDQWAPAARVVIEGLIGSGRNEAVVSTLSIMETLVRPMRQTPPGFQTMLDFFHAWPHLTVLPVTTPIAQEAASIRAQHRFKSVDALIIATGLVAGVSHLVTGDEQWKGRLQQIRAQMAVRYLGDAA